MIEISEKQKWCPVTPYLTRLISWFDETELFWAPYCLLGCGGVEVVMIFKPL